MTSSGSTIRSRVESTRSSAARGRARPPSTPTTRARESDQAGIPATRRRDRVGTPDPARADGTLAILLGRPPVCGTTCAAADEPHKALSARRLPRRQQLSPSPRFRARSTLRQVARLARPTRRDPAGSDQPAAVSSTVRANTLVMVHPRPCSVGSGSLPALGAVRLACTCR